MGLGKCILTTPVGAEGIQITSGENILIAATAAEWQKVLQQYLTGKLPVKQIAHNAATLIQQEYDNKLLIEKYMALYSTINSI